MTWVLRSPNTSGRCYSYRGSILVTGWFKLFNIVAHNAVTLWTKKQGLSLNFRFETVPFVS